MSIKKKKQQILLPHAGLKAALDLMSSLAPSEQQKIFDKMGKLDAKAAHFIQENMITLEDLIYLENKMLQKLLQQVSDGDLALIMRKISKKLKKHLLDNLSKMRQNEIQALLLGPRQPLLKVEEAQVNLMNLVREKIKRGELILNKNSDDTLV